MRLSLRFVGWLAGVAAFAATPGAAQKAPALVAIPELGLRVQRGFRVSLYADADLANDIQAMAINARGEVVVTGPGYIKTLHETKGRADSATLFATPKGGGMGMYCDGPSLYFSGNGWLSRYDDLDGDGVADRPPENLFPLGASEHGGHAIRKGPDGSLYLIGGNDSGFEARQLAMPGAAAPEIEGGALLRFAPDGRGAQALAHGFRNPYSFDFGVAGDLFTFDSDVESDFFLPWYTPTRFFHVAEGGHHGWRLHGWRRSWARPWYYADTVDILADMGRGSPTGLTCYRHRQFPARFRGGLFALDWTFGKVFFVPLQPDGASYQAQPELFLEPMGSHGFAPTDIAVGPSGSLFICIGGRKTRGAVFRIDYAGPPLLDPVVPATIFPNANVVLMAPQPFEAWLRAVWVPQARRLGAAPLQRATTDPTIDPIWRARAIEIVTELFGGLPQAYADAAAAAPSPLVRARTAWSLGRIPGPNPSLTLFPLLDDPHPLVRRCALEAVTEHLDALASPELVRLLLPNLGHSDKRVRQAAARAASLLPDLAWQALSTRLAQADPGTRLTGLMAQMWRHPGGSHPETLAPLAAILSQTKDPALRLDAIRLIILALGDWNLASPSIELYTACEPANLPPNQEPVLNQIRARTRALLPAAQPDLNAEAARLLAMLEDNDPRTVRVMLGLITPKSYVAADFHLLVCFARMRAWPADLTPKIADALLNLDLKLDASGHTKQNWPLRLTELTRELVRREPKLAPAMLAHPRFATPEHVHLATHLGPEQQAPAARLFLAAVRKDTNFPWSSRLIELLSLLPEKETRPLLRAQWNNILLRDDILIQLAGRPEVADRERFWQGLSAFRLEATRASVRALLELPRDPAHTNLLAPCVLLRRLLEEPKEKKLRAETLALLTAQTGQAFDIREPEVPEKTTLAHAAAVKAAWQPVFAWLAKKYPLVLRELDLNAGDDPARWTALLKTVPWAEGKPDRGQRLFTERGCALCHAGARPLGPDLVGVTGRFSVEDLFNAIIFPSRDIADLYRPTTFLMRDGSVVSGLVAFESADGVLVQTTPATTERLDERDIAGRQPSKISFMPTGLLEGLKPEALADLYSYLKSLQPRK